MSKYIFKRHQNKTKQLLRCNGSAAMILENRSTSTANCMTKEAKIGIFCSYAPSKVRLTQVDQKIRFFANQKVNEWLYKDGPKIQTMVKSTYTL